MNHSWEPGGQDYIYIWIWYDDLTSLKLNHCNINIQIAVPLCVCNDIYTGSEKGIGYWMSWGHVRPSLMSDATNTDEHFYLMVNSCAFWCLQKPLAFTSTYIGSLGIHFDVWHFVYILYFTWTAVAFNSILLYVTHILASYTVVSGFLSRLRIARCNQSITWNADPESCMISDGIWHTRTPAPFQHCM